MRICLVAHGFPPHECTGVEGYTNALAMALAEAGHRVEVFAPRHEPRLPNLSMRREERDGFGITWITTNEGPSNPEEMLDRPGVAIRFGDHLDREKPELIHFQHLIKLGLGLLEQAKSRHIPSLYTAHDYYSVCHRVTLTRPDMQRCETLGDAEACARCDLALAHLNRREELGDYQLGALQNQLDPDAWQQLSAILDGEPQEAGYSDEDQQALTQVRRQLDARRLEVYGRFDLILSPTEFLRERMIEGGLAPEKIEILTYGAETRDLADLPPVTHKRGEPLRFGYLGGLAKQKGVHVLLEAFGQLESKATLSIWGASSDTVYVEYLRKQAEEVGAAWMGSFERSGLREVLEQVDVVVVPSIWVENFPFVIREALAAGRPVITSDVGALPESICHEKDGLLFAPGDAKALTAAMTRCIEEKGLLKKLLKGIGPIKSIEEQITELVPIYTRLLGQRVWELDPNLPSSLHPWAERYAQLSDMPQRDLFRLVLERLTHMRRLLLGDGEKRTQTSPPSDALANYSKAQTLLRDLKRERVWLKTSVEDHEEADKDLRERVSWREEELDSSKKEVQWLNQTVAQREEETHWLKETLASKEEEIEWLRTSIRAKVEESNWLRQMVQEHQEKSHEQQKVSDDRHQEARDMHAQTQVELDASKQQFIKTMERLQANRELLGIASARLDELRKEMLAVGELAGQRLVFRHTKLGKRIATWKALQESDGLPEEDA